MQRYAMPLLAAPSEPVHHHDLLRVVCVPLSFVVTVVANVLSSLGAINGTTNADISNKYTTYFTPDGWAFSIWGIIYLWNAFYVLYQLLPVRRTDPRERILGWLFVATCLLNALWSVLFAYEKLVASSIIISAILVTLLAAEVVVWFGLPRGQTFDRSVLTRLIVAVNFSLYAGWLSVATIANWSIVGVSEGWHGEPWTEQRWSVLMQSVAALLALLVAVSQQDGIFAIPITVGLAAIASKNNGPWGEDSDSMSVAASSQSAEWVPDRTVYTAAVALSCVAAASIVIGELAHLFRSLCCSRVRSPFLPTGQYEDQYSRFERN